MDLIYPENWDQSHFIRKLRLRERMALNWGKVGVQPQPGLSGSSSSPRFLFFHLCTVPQK